MTKSPNEVLDYRVGGSTVADNLRRAIEAGKLVENEDGTLRLADDRSRDSPWLSVHNGPRMECRFLINFLFRHAYQRSAVPYGCRDCYKVKVVLRTLRELVAAWEIARRIECNSKWGVDLDNLYSHNVYAGYFYTSGLDSARVLFKVVREAFSQDPKLRPDTAMTIKRGCSEYEARVGPSDKFEFDPEMAAVEAYLRTKFQSNNGVASAGVPQAYWIDVAYRIGDDTYLDFTGGRPLRIKTLTYEP